MTIDVPFFRFAVKASTDERGIHINQALCEVEYLIDRKRVTIPAVVLCRRRRTEHFLRHVPWKSRVFLYTVDVESGWFDMIEVTEFGCVPLMYSG